MLPEAIGSSLWKKLIDHWGSNMCAIVDANAAHQVFGENRSSAGVEFFHWISFGTGSLVIGGKLRKELNRMSSFKEWQKEAILSGRVILAEDNMVLAEAMNLSDSGLCQSNDAHVIALARLSGARLLFSNDSKLQRDFKDKKLIDQPRGSVYSTLKDRNVTSTHKNLLRKNVCKK